MHDKIDASIPRLETINPNRRSSDIPLPLGQLGNPGNAALLEEMYEQWKLGADSLPSDWKAFFEGFELGCQMAPPTGITAPSSLSSTSGDPDYRLKQARVYNLLFAYRTLGHMKADLDPLGLEIPTITDLELSNFKFTQNDLDLTFDAGTLAGGGELKLRDIIGILEKTYSRHVAIEYMHIQNFTIRRWLRDRMEKCQNTPSFSREKQIRILNKLLSSELFERFLHTRYVGQKRFSLEGGETLIPILDAIVESSPSYGIEQIVMGVSHRGRLNVLVNILGKSYRSIFNEFADNHMPETVQGDGDVKYHLGFESVVTTSTGEKVTISLAPNPSHLEAVDPVVEGKARARQRLLHDTENRSKVIPLLVHGDAAFIGQGVVAETFNLSQLEGYRTGGTIHIVVNNQIGFTTSPKDGRSTVYCTALAKTLGVPIFHVNGDDPLACVYTLELALAFRQRFKKDVVVDMYCYRRRGHNEGDEPNYTQPILYSAIENHSPVSHVFLDALIASGTITRAEGENFQEKYNQKLSTDLGEAKAESSKVVPSIRKPITTPELLDPVETAVPLEKLQSLGRLLTTEPPGINLNSKIITLLKNRRVMIEGTQPLDWGTAESLAFGSIVGEGIPVRLSGQDSRRGTFSHRHSALYDINTRERYIPLKHVSLDQASFCVYNSPLSEAAVLGFDFGYSLDCPNMLMIWEAQFGDFANGAQTIIDQYITSSESKWGVTSRIVLLLPHGYEGQGPEHSSARLERFLTACAEDNIQVANCTTTASYFHILRRQAVRTLRKPLVIMTPKGLLRDKRSASPIQELATGRFQEIIPDTKASADATRIILCTGKVYYDLDDYRTANNRTDTAIIRLEQLYPLHEANLKKATDSFPKAQNFIWCQEESENFGAWPYIEKRLRRLFKRDFAYAGRDASASPATGSLAVHRLEQQDLIQQAFAL